MNFSGHHGSTLAVSAQVQALSARNLQLLQAIEGTLSRLSSDTNLLQAVANAFHEMQQRLEAEVPSEQIDRDGTICDAQKNAADAVQRMYAKAKRQHQSACDDPRLTSDDGVASAYEQYLKTLEDLYDSIESVREWIETHDALLEPVTGRVYTNVDDLFAAFGG